MLLVLPNRLSKGSYESRWPVRWIPDLLWPIATQPVCKRWLGCPLLRFPAYATLLLYPILDLTPVARVRMMAVDSNVLAVLGEPYAYGLTLPLPCLVLACRVWTGAHHTVAFDLAADRARLQAGRGSICTACFCREPLVWPAAGPKLTLSRQFCDGGAIGGSP